MDVHGNKLHPIELCTKLTHVHTHTHTLFLGAQVPSYTYTNILEFAKQRI